MKKFGFVTFAVAVAMSPAKVTAMDEATAGNLGEHAGLLAAALTDCKPHGYDITAKGDAVLSAGMRATGQNEAWGRGFVRGHNEWRSIKRAMAENVAVQQATDSPLSAACAALIIEYGRNGRIPGIVSHP